MPPPEDDGQRQARASALLHEREAKAEELAFKRGRESMRIDAHLSEHDRQLKAINGSIEAGVRATSTLTDRVGGLERAFEKYVDIAKTRSEIAVEAAQAALSKRTFILGCCAVVASCGGLIELLR